MIKSQKGRPWPFYSKESKKRGLDARRPCLALLRSARWASHSSILKNGHFPYKSMSLICAPVHGRADNFLQSYRL